VNKGYDNVQDINNQGTQVPLSTIMGANHKNYDRD